MTHSRVRTPVRVAAALLAVAMVALTLAPRQASAGQLIGQVPGPGALGLVVWSGGPVEDIRAALNGSSCSPRSAWVTRRGGGLVGYLYGAPDVVNSGFRAEAGATLPTNTPLVLVCAPLASAAAPAPAPPAAASDFTALEQQMLTLVNQARAAIGLAPFTLDSALSSVARAHSADMVARSYFDHTSPDGLSPFDRMTRAGIAFRSAAENIAWAGTVAVAHDSLMKSPGHRANLLNPALNRIGLGIVQKDNLHIMVTQLFKD